MDKLINKTTDRQIDKRIDKNYNNMKITILSSSKSIAKK